MRSHNEGSIFRRKTGRDAGVWVSAVTMRDGRRASRTSHSRDEAKAELAELIRLRDARAPITDRIRLGDYLARWVSDVKADVGPATWRKHESCIRLYLAPSLGSTRLSDLRPADVMAFMAEAGRELDPRSVGHLRATLRRALADAVRDGLVTRNAAALAKPPGLPHRERTILDASQARHLIEATRDTRYGPLWTILLTTGLRISEALGLAWSAVNLGGNDGHVGSPIRSGDPARDWSGDGLLGSGRVQVRAGDGGERQGSGASVRGQGPSLTVRHQLAREDGEWVRRKPKTAKGRREIPLTPLGVEALRRQRAMQDADLGSTPRPIDGLVFTSEAGRPLHGTNTLKDLYAALDTAGLPRVTQHDLRHSCATILFGMGVPIEVIADILGHSTVRVTQDLYRHRIPELSRDAADKMQAALG